MKQSVTALEFGMEQKTERLAGPGRFVQRIYKLVPLTEAELDAYAPGSSNSGRYAPQFREELVSERYFEGIG